MKSKFILKSRILVLFSTLTFAVTLENFWLTYPSFATTTTYSQTFTSGVLSSSSSQATAWTSFRASLTGSYDRIVMSSTNSNFSLTLIDSVKIPQVATALKDGTSTQITISGKIISIGSCGGIEFTVHTSSSTCACLTDVGIFTLRPTINNQNWGGAGGTTCNATTQTITLTFTLGSSNPPAISSSATISGTTTYGSALSSTTGTWTNSPTSYSYRWSRSATSGGTYTAISGATSSSYTLVAADVGQYLKVAVTATNADGSATDTSTATAAIAAKALTIKAADKSASYTGSSVSVTNSYSITAGALVGSDTFTALTYTYTSVSPSYNSTTAPTAAGTYTITPSAASFSVGSAASYLITYDTATLTISSVSSSATITVAVGTLTYRTTKSISAVASVAGKLTFKANNTTISGCKNLAANSGNSFTRSCSYKPSTRGYVTISVTLVPTDTSYNSSVTKSDTYFVYQRSGSR